MSDGWTIENELVVTIDAIYWEAVETCDIYWDWEAVETCDIYWDWEAVETCIDDVCVIICA